MRRVAVCTFVLLLGSISFGQTIRSRAGFILPSPPVAESHPVVDNYFGTKITDDFRWLENAKSPETRAFIDEENVYTTRYLKQAPIHNQILDDLDPLEHTSRWSIPIQRAGNYYFMKRLAGEEQDSIYMRHGWTGVVKKGQPSAPKDERLIDPAAFSRDPNTSVRLADVSRDGLLIAYEIRQGVKDIGAGVKELAQSAADGKKAKKERATAAADRAAGRAELAEAKSERKKSNTDLRKALSRRPIKG